MADSRHRGNLHVANPDACVPSATPGDRTHLLKVVEFLPISSKDTNWFDNQIKSKTTEESPDKMRLIQYNIGKHFVDLV